MDPSPKEAHLADASVAHRPPPIDDEALVLFDQPFLGLKSVRRVEHLLDSAAAARLVHEAALPADCSLIGPSVDGSAVGLRYFVPPEKGSGYWDTFRPLRHAMLSVTDSSYLTPSWVDNAGEGVFKLRILLAGRLLDERGVTLLEAPGAVLCLYPQGRDTGYLIAPGVRTRMLVLHCFPNALAETLGLGRSELPSVLQPLVDGAPVDQQKWIELQLTNPLFQAVQQVLESRYDFSGTYRLNFLQAKTREILSIVLGALRTQEIGDQASVRLRPREINKVLEACDYLDTHFRSPPTIKALARRIGMSETKLKTSFRQVRKLTIHQYVQASRMQLACKLLLDGDRSIAEVAYAVGYPSPSSFTQSFKAHHGYLPKVLKARRGTV